MRWETVRDDQKRSRGPDFCTVASGSVDEVREPVDRVQRLATMPAMQVLGNGSLFNRQKKDKIGL